MFKIKECKTDKEFLFFIKTQVVKFEKHIKNQLEISQYQKICYGIFEFSKMCNNSQLVYLQLEKQGNIIKDMIVKHYSKFSINCEFWVLGKYKFLICFNNDDKYQIDDIFNEMPLKENYDLFVNYCYKDKKFNIFDYYNPLGNKTHKNSPAENDDSKSIDFGLSYQQNFLTDVVARDRKEDKESLIVDAADCIILKYMM